MPYSYFNTIPLLLVKFDYIVFDCIFYTSQPRMSFYHSCNLQTATAARRVLRDGDELQGAADERAAAAK